MEIRQGTYEQNGKQHTVDIRCYDEPEFKAGDVLECIEDRFADQIIRVVDVAWSGVHNQGRPERFYVYQRYDEEDKNWEGRHLLQPTNTRTRMNTWTAEYGCSAIARIEQNYKKYNRLKALIIKGWVVEDADDSKGR